MVPNDPDAIELLKQTRRRASRLAGRMAGDFSDLESTRGVEATTQAAGLSAIRGVLESAVRIQEVADRALVKLDQQDPASAGQEAK
jgi:hypothetical protein